jgi:hypothetical protein
MIRFFKSDLYSQGAVPAVFIVASDLVRLADNPFDTGMA